MSQDISKQELYESVKTLVEIDGKAHLHLCQHKLFTLFSIAFQFLLYSSTKNPGSYVIRIEDCMLADKIAKKAKDPSTRKFIQSLLIPRRLKYGPSTFYLDFFHIGSWNFTKDIPIGKLKGALVVKNTSSRPLDEIKIEDDEGQDLLSNLPSDYYISTIKEHAEKLLVIAFDNEFDGLKKIEFPFIKKGPDRPVHGVKFAKDINFDELE